MQPSGSFLKTVQEFEKCFLLYHGETINPQKNCVLSLVKILQSNHPTMNSQIIKKFVRTRTFIRMKFLNQMLKNSSHQRRNRQQIKQFSS